MKVLLINKFHYLKGGAERVYFETKRILEENGHEVICFSMQDKKNIPCTESEFFVPHVDFSDKTGWYKKAWRFIYYKEASRRLEKLIQEEKPDIAHLHNVYHQLTYSILKPLKKYHIPIVQTLHDYHMIAPDYNLYSHNKICESCRSHKFYKCAFSKCIQNSFWSSLWGSLESYLNWFAGYAKRIDQFIAPSKFLADKYAEWDFKYPIKVIHNSLELNAFEPEFTPGDYIVYFGRLSREKGVKTLCQAVRKMPNVKLKIIGTGPEAESLEDYLQEKQVSNIELLGQLSGTELFETVKCVRFVVVPSQWLENYPMIVIEAMALGKPVLASRLGGLTEMITENYNGWFFEAGNTLDLQERIKRIYDNGPLIEQLGRNARRTVEIKNSSEEYYKEIMSIYNFLVQSNKVGLG
ncbi:MAG: group 1 glycosyl transferase [Parcubacteria group bacterium GW2011_GWC2_39_14]|nr:MAG: group 1 glycosyl transferase [Parcubacteria group bacterium GW2011_GWC2_39_14]KKR54616.1 MAG: group 1 glycosyl transferase [Parcubacteria group bacterium GW2011_GWA2_40_23]